MQDVPRDHYFVPLVQIVWDFPLPLVIVPLEWHPRTGGQFPDTSLGGAERIGDTRAHGPGSLALN